MTKSAGLVFAGVLALFPVLGAAQQHTPTIWSVEIRLGASVPAEDFGDSELDPGLGFEGTVIGEVAPWLGFYLGWGWHRFDSGSIDLDHNGYVAGVQLSLEPIYLPFGVRGRAGFTYEHLEQQNEAGDLFDDTGHSAGYEVGVALPFQLTRTWSVSPGLRYRAWTDESNSGSALADRDLNYISVDVGFATHF